MQAKVGNKSYINKQIEDADFKIKKKFGQNFLTDQNILTEIIDAADLNNDVAVIEIGPGLGSLTERLVSKAGFVLCYEIDDEVIPLLKKNLSDLISSNFHITFIKKLNLTFNYNFFSSN